MSNYALKDQLIEIREDLKGKAGNEDMAIMAQANEDFQKGIK